jgi:hypothetical protein
VGTSRSAKAIPIPVVQKEAAIPARGIFTRIGMWLHPRGTIGLPTNFKL